jgi:hypothetical protein
MNIKELKDRFVKFRLVLYSTFVFYADAIMNLLDALSGNQSATSVVELSLNPLFDRTYSSLPRAIGGWFDSQASESVIGEQLDSEEQRQSLIASMVPPPQARPFWLFATDVTPQPRQFADTLADRSVVHAPNAVLSNKPISIGHQYSVVVALPEKETSPSPPWVIPLSVERVASEQSALEVGSEQLHQLLEQPHSPFEQQLCVHVGDTSYSAVEYLASGKGKPDLVQIARLRGNRVLYSPAPSKKDRPSAGHPTWYGERFALKDSSTWSEPEEIVSTSLTSRKGKTYQVEIQAWDQLLMRGKKGIPMHQFALKLIRVQLFRSNGQPFYQRPLWLIVAGERRHELSLIEIWDAYRQRYDIEHFFRFGKQKLLMDKYQTPEVEHEENWWQLVSLAYLQLWLAAPLAQNMPRPWETEEPIDSTTRLSPTRVQRDFQRIIQQMGTPAQPPKPRGYSPGRRKGDSQKTRKKQKVVFKGKKQAPLEKKIA